jgi:hypothetical protein
MKTAVTLARVALGIGLPTALFYLLRAEGVSDLVALAAGAVLPALGALFTLLVRRRVDAISVFMAATMGLALLTSALTGSPRFLLAKDGLLTGAWGVWFLVSARGQRPAALIFARPLMEPMRLFAVRSWDPLWDAEPKFRRIWRIATVTWGAGLLIDAIVRVVISYTLPVAAVPAIGGLLYPVTFVVLQVVGNVYFHRAGLYRLLGARWLTARAAGAQVGRGTGIPKGAAGLRYMQTHISQRREAHTLTPLHSQGGLPCSSDSSRSATSPATRPPTTRRARRSASTRW